MTEAALIALVVTWGLWVVVWCPVYRKLYRAKDG
jgi:hypothetical protein